MGVMFNGMAPILERMNINILKGECQVSEENKKEPIVKLFNKGQRIITYIVSREKDGEGWKNVVTGNINPLETVPVPESEAKRLLKMFDKELISVGEGQSSEGAADQNSAQVKALEDEAIELKATIEKMKEDAVEASEGKDQSKEVSDLKSELEEVKKDNADLLEIIEKGEKDKKALVSKVKALEKKLNK